MMNILYILFIYPLELIFEIIYSFSYYVTNNPGISIIALSFVLNILMLPINKKADEIQDQENKKQQEMKPWIDHIKKAFIGDEQYFVLQTYYRQNNYKPIYSLRSSISIALEIPFFMAAYHFLSNLKAIQEVGFYFIDDLGKPDGLLFGINVLPILMTIINIISCVIYTKGQSKKQKITLYLMALVFLVLLYNAPAGLAFYYLLNNLFSLVKNIINRFKKSKFIICIACSFIGIIGFVYFIFINPMSSLIKELFVLVLLIMLQAPLILYKHKFNINLKFKKSSINFYMCCLFLTFLFGLLTPSQTVVSSASEFVDKYSLTNPLSYVFNTFLLSFGLFMIWINLFHYLASDNIKKVFELSVFVLSGIAILNTFFFGTNNGNLSSTLRVDNNLSFTTKESLINILCILILSLVLILIYLKKQKLIKNISIILVIASLGVSVINIKNIKSDVNNAILMFKESQEKADSIRFNLSKTKKNVVIIVLDRAINSYFSYILEELPELKDTYSGFTYYPNTLSYGGNTAKASPALYGGYEYTPEEINNRTNETMKEKHNEALQVLPALFDKYNYETTIFDMPYANYEIVPDYSIFEKYNNINTYLTDGIFKNDKYADSYDLSSLNRNLFCYSVMKASPLLIQNALYGGGSYNQIDYYLDYYSEGVSVRHDIESRFIDLYSVLLNLKNMTNIIDNDGGLFIMHNETAHTPTILKEPEYEPMNNVDNTEYDMKHSVRYSLEGQSISLKTKSQMEHYHVNAASLIKIGEWLDYLRQENIYDNTKIIIVSDHGYELKQYDELLFGKEGGEDVMSYNPLLLVKDFNSKEFNIDYSFMTNADVPYLAVKDTLDETINLFTGVDLNQSYKKEKEQLVSVSTNPGIDKTGKETSLEGPWYTVKENIFDINNWSKVD